MGPSAKNYWLLAIFDWLFETRLNAAIEKEQMLFETEL